MKLVGNLLTVSVDGKVWCSNKNYWTSDPGRKGVKVYGSDPWYNAADARLKDFDYEKVEAPKATPVIQGPTITVKKNNVLKHITTYAEYTFSAIYVIECIIKANSNRNDPPLGCWLTRGQKSPGKGVHLFRLHQRRLE